MSHNCDGFFFPDVEQLVMKCMLKSCTVTVRTQGTGTPERHYFAKKMQDNAKCTISYLICEAFDLL